MSSLLSFFIMFFLISNAVHAQVVAQPQICNLVNTDKKPSAYLVDEKYLIQKGPIDLGRLPISSQLHQEGYIIHTQYTVISTSKLAKPLSEAPMGGAIILKKSKSICKKSVAYQVLVLWDFRPGGIRPYKFKDQLPKFTLDDDYGHEIELENFYKFDPTVIGELVEPK